VQENQGKEKTKQSSAGTASVSIPLSKSSEKEDSKSHKQEYRQMKPNLLASRTMDLGS